MLRLNFLKLFIFVLPFSMNIWGQGVQTPPLDIEVVYEDDLTPSVIKALPDWENLKDKAIHIKDSSELQKAVGGQRGVLDLIDFTGGNEAVIAEYDAGKLLIVEFASPQVSFETDNKIRERFAQTPPSPPVYYRRIGNYNVFVFDGKDEAAASDLLGKIKYQKSIKWLGEDPFYYNRAERHFVQNTLQLFLSTISAIGLILGTVLVLGVVVGLVYFRMRNQKIKATVAFSDAGGMTRLNLDELTSEIPSERLLQ